jgi:hypothetical protein
MATQSKAVDLHRDISIDESLGHWGRFAAAALSRSLCVDAQTAVSASVQIARMDGRWFNDAQRAARLLAYETRSSEDRDRESVKT